MESKNSLEQQRGDKATQAGIALAKPGRTRAKKYRSFEEARAFATSLQLASRKQWRDYVKSNPSSLPTKPQDVPAHPDGIYKTKGWQGWRHWLGTEKSMGNHAS